MIRLDLSGCTVASFTAGGGFHAVDVPRGCVTCTAAREMLALGVDPAEEIDVRRDGKPVFLRCFTVKTWADLMVSEDGDRSVRFRPYRGAEPPHSGDPALRVSDCPEDETPVYGSSIPGVG